MIDELVRRGIVRFEYQHYLGHGQPSVLSALATECAGDQGQWWRFHDHYMSTQDFSRDGAVALAAEIGLDRDTFAQCLDDEVHLDAVNQQHINGREAGVRFTPTIHVNGEGAPTTEALIEYVLELSGQSN